MVISNKPVHRSLEANPLKFTSYHRPSLWSNQVQWVWFSVFKWSCLRSFWFWLGSTRMSFIASAWMNFNCSTRISHMQGWCERCIYMEHLDRFATSLFKYSTSQVNISANTFGYIWFRSSRKKVGVASGQRPEGGMRRLNPSGNDGWFGRH